MKTQEKDTMVLIYIPLDVHHGDFSYTNRMQVSACIEI